MENLLSLAFDNLSSYDGPKVRKGLRQVEGLLASICLPKQQQHDKSKDRRSSVIHEDELPRPKALDELAHDPAFYEFFRLQEGFEWNVALRLVNTLDRLLARGADGSNDLLILSALDLTQGILLLHPPSKSLFSREMYMNLLLDLLEPDFCPAIQSATLLTLVVALLDAPQNTRTFENLDGLLTVTSLFRSRGTARDVKLKLVEFLYFYLMPEVPTIPSSNSPDGDLLQRSPSKLAKAFASSSSRPNSSSDSSSSSNRDRSSSNGSSGSGGGGGGGSILVRSQEEKQALLGRHLNSVDELVRDLRGSTPFGGVVV